MASKYGYMAKIGADTSGLTAALSDVENNMRNISAELKTVNEGLKLEGGENTQNLTAKYDLLSDAIENTRKKLEQLKSAEEAVNSAAENGDISANEQRKYRTEIANTESRLRQYQQELANTQRRLDAAENDTGELSDETKQLGNTLEDTGKSAITFGDLLKSNIAGDLIADGLHMAADKVKDFVSNGIELASNLSEVQNVVDVTFGDGAAQIYEWADAAAESFGMSSLSAQQYTGTLGAMMKSMGLADDEVLKMSTDMVGLAGDMASFYNLDISTAFEKIRSGMSGETEPLKQLGINMSVANLEAYALSQGIEKAYKNMTEAEKATLRYNYIMQQTADAQGDFARTSDSFANQQRILQMNMDNLSASLGQKLLPSINEVFDTANEKLPKLENTIENIGEILGKVTSFALEHHEAILGVASAYLTYQGAMKAGKGISDIVGAFKNLTSVTKTATAAQQGMNAAAAANPYVLLASAIAAVTVGIVSYVMQLDSAIESEKEIKKAAEETMVSAEAEARTVEAKANRYNLLYEEYKRTGVATGEMIELAKELQELSPDTIKLIDEEKNKYYELSESIDDVISKIRLKGIEQAKSNSLDSYYNNITEYYTQQAQAYQNYSKAVAGISNETLAELEKGSEGAYKDFFENTTGEYGEFGINRDAAMAAAGLDYEAYQIYTDAIYQRGLVIDSTNTKIAETEKLIEETSASYDKLAESIGGANEAETSTTPNYWGELYEQRATEQKQAAENSAKATAEELTEYEKALEEKVTALDDSLKLRKISEKEYYSELKKYLDENTNTESKAYFEQLTRYEEYLQKQTEAAKKQLTEEEKLRVEAVKSSWNKITADRERGNITDEQEYTLKSQLVKKYCNENEDTWNEYYTWLYKYVSENEEEIAEEQLSAWEKSSKSLSDKLSKEYADLVKQKERVKQELLNIDLSETLTGKDGKPVEILTDLDAEIKKIDKYTASMDRLKSTGISDSLLSRINEMSYEDGSRQRFIDTLLGLSEKNRNLYYDDWERLQEKSESASQDIISDKQDELNKETASAVKNIFGNMPETAYEEGAKTAESFLQGIIDNMGGLNDISVISDILTSAYNGMGKTAGGTSAAQQADKVILTSTPITINLNDKQYIKTTVGELIEKGQRSGGNEFKL